MKRSIKNAESTPNFARLIRTCEGILRVEVRLRKSELAKLGLSFVSDWNLDKARAVFRKYVAKLPMLDVTTGPFSVDELTNIPDRLREAYALHKLGQDLSPLYSRRTFYRRLSDFRSIGIDIRCPNLDDAPSNSSLSFVPKGTPRWLIDAEMAPPRKRKSLYTRATLK